MFIVETSRSRIISRSNLLMQIGWNRTVNRSNVYSVNRQEQKVSKSNVCVVQISRGTNVGSSIACSSIRQQHDCK